MRRHNSGVAFSDWKNVTQTPDPGLSKLENAKALARQVLIEHADEILTAVVLAPQNTGRNELAVIVLRTIRAQYVGSNGGYITIERLRKLADLLDPKEGSNDAHERRS